MRYMLLMLVPAVLVLSATSSPLISLLYGPDYAQAASALRILVFGLAFLTVFFVLAHVVMGSGRPSVVMAIGVPMVAVDIVLNMVLVPRYGLPGAAWATTITCFFGMIAGAAYVLRRFEALVSIRSFVKIWLASLAVYGVATQVSLSPYLLPLVYAGLFVMYLVLLLLMREFSRTDLDTLRRVIPLARFGG